MSTSEEQQTISLDALVQGTVTEYMDRLTSKESEERRKGGQLDSLTEEECIALYKAHNTHRSMFAKQALRSLEKRKIDVSAPDHSALTLFHFFDSSRKSLKLVLRVQIGDEVVTTHRWKELVTPDEGKFGTYSKDTYLTHEQREAIKLRRLPNGESLYDDEQRRQTELREVISNECSDFCTYIAEEKGVRFQGLSTSLSKSTIKKAFAFWGTEQIHSPLTPTLTVVTRWSTCLRAAPNRADEITPSQPQSRTMEARTERWRRHSKLRRLSRKMKL